ncbi:Pentatricopeptide repeat-containing protein [Artemisia annua]|uniref:Pentatricopeptide repeat-containing protein n=1 Tax=Artemisia annua TaxID=35608 RepID=A0A2U1Q3H8_ARTAN|nr:Pentatricopeptide repeat-containing protein [Artemisia annua]
MVLGFILSGDAWGVFGGMCVRDLVSWNSMVDGYVKVGDLGRAHRVFDEMGERNVQSSLWDGLLGSCRFKGDVVLGEQIAKALLEDDPLNHSHHVLLLITNCKSSA